MQTDELRPGLTAAGRSAFKGGGDVNVAAIAAELQELAARIARIRPMSDRNPSFFYEERSEVAHQVRAIAEWLRTGRKPVDRD